MSAGDNSVQYIFINGRLGYSGMLLPPTGKKVAPALKFVEFVKSM